MNRMGDSLSEATYLLCVDGVVQGVGFRPFVYHIAKRMGLKGYVLNDGSGVEIVVNISTDRLQNFIEILLKERPPLSAIERIDAKKIDFCEFDDFKILSKGLKGEKSTIVLPDIAVCRKCLEEMFDPDNRRYRHPFITCTDCGPRYTIVRTVPYDRENTSMSAFEMCPRCREEYENPLDRRYHAQPIGCWSCGPTLDILERKEAGGFGRALHKDSYDSIEEFSADAVALFAERIAEGEIGALKGIGGFHLLCDATNPQAVRRLRERKRRPAKPFAIMVPDIEMADRLAYIGEAERELLLCSARPVVLLDKRESEDIVCEEVAPAIGRLGIMLPYTPLHYLLFEHIRTPLVATSANLSDEPIITDSEELLSSLGSVVDIVLDHNREILNACDDSVAQVVGERVQWLRTARGVAPLSIALKKRGGDRILAVGANQKSTIAIRLEGRAIVSPHIGDLASIGSIEFFERTIGTFGRFYDFVPDSLVCDSHPGYESGRWAQRMAKERAISLKRIQHHYAHALAVMAENGIEEKALAFVWDGTGYGEDGTVWGSEVMLADREGFERIYSLRPFRLLGAERAVREPRRVALSLLFELYPLDEILKMDNPAVEAFEESEIRLLHQSWSLAINSPVSTSMGRLFDALASLRGLLQIAGYEGQSGLMLEREARRHPCEKSTKVLKLSENSIEWSPMVEMMTAGVEIADISACFHRSLARIVAEISELHPQMPIILAGGVFQNRTLCEEIFSLLEKRDIYMGISLPPNDASISMGQLFKAL
jgi:hydrogenase maturation protein HypF